MSIKRIYVLIIFLIYVFHPFNLKADFKEFYFALLKANPFYAPEINKKGNDIKLRFMDKIKCSKYLIKDGIQWYRCIKDGFNFYLPYNYLYDGTFKSYYTDSSGNIIIGSARIDRLYGIPLKYRPNDLVKVENRYKASKYMWRDMMLRKEAYNMFAKMIEDAEFDGIDIKIISAFRDAKYQAGLYTRAIKKRGIFQNSVAKPGHSEHQLGTACDLTTSEIDDLLSRDFEKTDAYKWLSSNSWRYGIFLTYPSFKQRYTGYTYEPWHYRYWGKNYWKNIFSNYSIKLR